MNAIAKAIDAINELFGRIIAPLIAIITLIVLYDIVSRFFFGRPSDWAFDVTKMLFGAHFMLMAAYGLRHHAHVVVPFIWLLLTYGWRFFERSFSRGETTYGMVSIPVYPVKGVIVVAAALILLQAIAIVLHAIMQLREEKSA